jgi:hypothetical protein
MCGSFNLFFKEWNLVLDNVPNDGEINIEIFMNYSVSQSYNFPPGNIGKFILHVRRDTVCGFADNFQIPNYRINNNLLRSKSIERQVFRVMLNFVDTFEDVS